MPVEVTERSPDLATGEVRGTELVDRKSGQPFTFELLVTNSNY